MFVPRPVSKSNSFHWQYRARARPTVLRYRSRAQIDGQNHKKLFPTLNVHANYSPHRLIVVNDVISLSVFPLYKLFSSFGLTFSETRLIQSLRNFRKVSCVIKLYYCPVLAIPQKSTQISPYMLLGTYPLQWQQIGCFQNTRMRQIIVKSLIILLKC